MKIWAKIVPLNNLCPSKAGPSAWPAVLLVLCHLPEWLLPISILMTYKSTSPSQTYLLRPGQVYAMAFFTWPLLGPSIYKKEFITSFSFLSYLAFLGYCTTWLSKQKKKKTSVSSFHFSLSLLAVVSHKISSILSEKILLE